MLVNDTRIGCFSSENHFCGFVYGQSGEDKPMIQLDCLPVEVQRQIMHSVRDGRMDDHDSWEFETFCTLGGVCGHRQPAFGVTLSQFKNDRSCWDSDDLGKSWEHVEWSAPAIYFTPRGIEMALMTYAGP